MACEEWRARLVTRLYDESDPGEARAVDAHVDDCAPCRATLAELADTRRTLRESAPDLPAPRPLVIVAPPRGAFGRATRLAVGLAAAAAVLAVGVAIGVGVAGRPGAAGAAVDAATMRAALDDQERRIERLVDDRLGATSTDAGRAVTIDDLDRAIETLRSAIDRGRREDVDFLLAEIAAAEIRSGAALDATRERLRYYALAENPGATEW